MFKPIKIIKKDSFDTKPKHMYGIEIESPNGEDTVTVDVPLVIRLLEFAKEDAKSDLDLHHVAEKLVELGAGGKTLTMDHYAKIVNQPSVMTEKTMVFRMNSRTLWSRFAWSLLNYSIALNSEIDGKEQAEARIYAHADKIGNLIAPYFGEDTAKALSGALTTFGRIGVAVMQDLKAGKPLNGTKELWDKNIDDIASFLSILNPHCWPKEEVKSYFDMFVKLWLDSIKARGERDWVSNEIAIDNLDKLVTTGTDHDSSLADIFSKGTIYKFPDKFIE